MLALTHSMMSCESFPKSPHFTVMSAIDAATVRWSEAKLRLRRPCTETVTSLASIALSTFASLSSTGRVTFEAIMAQFVRMDARLDTLNDELCQVNNCVSRIARRQVVMGGFTVAFSPSPSAFEDESDDGSSSDGVDEDNGASSPSDDEMST